MPSTDKEPSDNPVAATSVPPAIGLLARRYWKAPFRYDATGSLIWDANNQRALDVRGWGYLTGQGALGLHLSDAKAAEIQDDLGAAVVKALNVAW